MTGGEHCYSAGKGLLPFILEIFPRRAIFTPCQSTSFIVKNATKTAKFWCAPAIGRAPNAPSAAQRNSRRNFLSLLPPTLAEPALLPEKAKAAVAAPAVAATNRDCYRTTSSAEISRKSFTVQSG